MRLIVCFLVIVSSTLAVVFTPSETHAGSWNDGNLVYGSSPAKAWQSIPCTEVVQPLAVSGLDSPQEVCVMGSESMFFGTYFANGQAPQTAIGYPLDQSLSRLYGVCENFWGCDYSSKADRLVELQPDGPLYRKAVVYEHVSTRIQRVFDGESGELQYQFDRSNPDYILTDTTGESIKVGTIALSENGKWLVAEIRNKGTALANLESRQARRVIAYGPQYGYGHDPFVEFAVANDGGAVALMGENAPLELFEITPECGEPLTPEMIESPETIYCSFVIIDTAHFSSHFWMGIKPHFDPSGKRLDFISLSGNGDLPRRVSVRTYDYQQQASISYLALGDSFTSGEGETDDRFYLTSTNDESGKCHVSRRSYPFLLADAFTLPSNGRQNVACAGAKIHDVLFQGKMGRVPQAEFVRLQEPEVATIGISGNDAGLMSKLRSCAMPDRCEWLDDKGRLQTGQEIRALFDRLVGMYQELQNDSPHTRFFAVGYPQAIVHDGICTPLVGLLLNQDERHFMEQSIEYLNDVIRSAAKKASVGYIDIEDSLDGHQLCSGSLLSAMNGVRVGDDSPVIASLPMLKIIGGESFHPTPYGHQLISESILRDYADLMQRPACSEDDCGLSDAPLPPEYWSSETPVSEIETQHAVEFVSSERLVPGDVASASLSAGSFLPSSQVRFELHSTPHVIGSFLADEDGSLSISFLVPDNLSEGYHTLHLYGSSYSRQPIDVYQTLAFGEPEEIGSLAPMQSAPTAQELLEPTILSVPLSALAIISPDMTIPQAVLGVSTDRKTAESSHTALPNLWPIALTVGALVLLALLVVVICRRNSTRGPGGYV